eukprot:CAMPEP_0173175622 /NCGR_PEP_ID=MMETSP1141-20130122/4012_1 /TAXON_ID=483371 /ORGANISM="non described non described, Strain CCMP2298" /LENGTH=138 /DNA_ID=CAMNT_0014097881 /DNA_START=140 /DNA_END=556 /DNA_ORIENTATION=-
MSSTCNLKHGGLHHVTLLHERLEEELHYVRSVEEDPVEPEVEPSGQGERPHGHAEVESVQQEVLVEDVLVLLRAVEDANQCAGSGVNRVVVVEKRFMGYWDLASQGLVTATRQQTRHAQLSTSGIKWKYTTCSRFRPW